MSKSERVMKKYWYYYVEVGGVKCFTDRGLEVLEYLRNNKSCVCGSKQMTKGEFEKTENRMMDIEEIK